VGRREPEEPAHTAEGPVGIGVQVLAPQNEEAVSAHRVHPRPELFQVEALSEIRMVLVLERGRGGIGDQTLALAREPHDATAQEIYARLRELKSKYDPHNFFRTNVNVKPK
jgi:FAD/FMN-containing dehydrogenase